MPKSLKTTTSNGNVSAERRIANHSCLGQLTESKSIDLRPDHESEAMLMAKSLITTTSNQNVSAGRRIANHSCLDQLTGSYRNDQQSLKPNRELVNKPEENLVTFSVLLSGSKTSASALCARNSECIAVPHGSSFVSGPTSALSIVFVRAQNVDFQPQTSAEMCRKL